jgi:hypothetical protein
MVSALTLAVLVALAGCGGGGGGRPPARTFALASTGVQAAPGEPQFFAMRPADLASDADVVSVHQDFYGVPWDAFSADVPTPPAEWVALMDAIKAQYAGRRIFLSLQLAGGATRDDLADRTTIVGGVVQTAHFGVPCYDFATAPDGPVLRAAWGRYVTWMVRQFDPEWVNVGVELNLFAVQCPVAWAGMVATEVAGYDAAKAAKPTVLAFPSFQIDTLYGRQQCTADDAHATPAQRAACYEANYAQLAGLKRDRFAVSTYPQGDPEWTHPADVDADYLTRGADRGGERLLVAETGWDSRPLAATLGTSCVTAKAFTEADTDAWLERVLAAADARQVDLVTWWSNRDLIPGALSDTCTYDATWQPVVDVFRGGGDDVSRFFGELGLKIFGTMGIRESDGTPKGAPFQRWKAAQARPLVAR